MLLVRSTSLFLALDRLRSSSSGYISGAVLERFRDHPDVSNAEITAIVRNPRKAEKFKEFGINAFVGSFSDAKLVEDLTAAADVVVDIVGRIILSRFHGNLRRLYFRRMQTILTALKVCFAASKEGFKRQENLRSSSILSVFHA